MRHAILGAGGVGLLVGGALAHAGRPVVLVLRQAALDEYPGGIHVESPLLGELDPDVPASARLDRPVDVLWVTVKATQLEEALRVASPAVAPDAVVVPLLNGVDHVARLREVYGELVIAGAIRVESERVGPGHVVHSSPFVAVELGPPAALRDRADAIAAELTEARISCAVREDGEAQVLWSKLAMLGPLALATSSLGRPIGGVREDAEVRELMCEAVREVAAVAAGEGATVDADAVTKALLGLPAGMRSSMQKDLAAGRSPEVDAIAGPVLRRGHERGVPVPAIEELVRRVAGAKAV